MNVQTDKKILRILSKFGSKRSSLPRLYHHIQRIFSGKGGRRMDQDMYALMSYCGYMLSLKNRIGSKQSRARRVKIPILSRAPKPLFSCFGEGGISPFRLHGLNVNGPKPRRGANALNRATIPPPYRDIYRGGILVGWEGQGRCVPYLKGYILYHRSWPLELEFLWTSPSQAAWKYHR